MADKIELTDKQEEAVGQLFVDYFGANFQTGKAVEKDAVHVSCKYGPNTPVMGWNVYPDGTVINWSVDYGDD